MIYAYLRVSSADQNLARQITAVQAYAEIDKHNIFSDKQSGKDFDRTNYQRLKQKVAAGDELVVEEMERFGRNKIEIKSELEWFKQNGVRVRILTVPTTLVDFKGQEWLGDMVNNILIEVLGAVAERDRVEKARVAKEGIIEAKKKNVYKGRKPGAVKKLPEQKVRHAKKQVMQGNMTIQEASAYLGITPVTWYRRFV